ncbi:MAG: CaiB/BaiF CoA-transferase family protein [Pseudoxanthomonas sp.]
MNTAIPVASGPLRGLKVVEFVGLGPAPFCAMMLADMGAEVIRIDQKRPQGAPSSAFFAEPRFDILARGRRSLALDLKHPDGLATALHLIGRADALVEGFRPGVMERLGVGPDVCLTRNPKLVYGRVTGWGQSGPLALAAGHDLNYIALTGALYGIGDADRPPTVPLNLIGDFGGGAMMLAFGIACALLEAGRSGRGQVVDAAMTDGAALLSAVAYAFKAGGTWSNERAANLLDGGAPFYACYACQDGKFVAVGAIEPQFYSLLRERLGLQENPLFDAQHDRARWPEQRRVLSELFASRSRVHWCGLLEGSDACFAPVLDWDEAPAHPHNVARGTFVEIDGVVQPAPAPRFSASPGSVQCAPSNAGEHGSRILSDWNVPEDRIAELERLQVI